MLKYEHILYLDEEEHLEEIVMVVLETPYQMAVNVAKRFRMVRKAKKMTIKEVSERSGVPYSTLRRFESTGEISFMGFVKIMSTIGEDREIQGLLLDWIPGSIDELVRYNSL